MPKKQWSVRYKPNDKVREFTDAESPYTRAQAIEVAKDLAQHNPKWHIYIVQTHCIIERPQHIQVIQRAPWYQNKEGLLEPELNKLSKDPVYLAELVSLLSDEVAWYQTQMDKYLKILQRVDSSLTPEEQAVVKQFKDRELPFV